MVLVSGHLVANLPVSKNPVPGDPLRLLFNSSIASNRSFLGGDAKAAPDQMLVSAFFNDLAGLNSISPVEDLYRKALARADNPLLIYS